MLDRQCIIHLLVLFVLSLGCLQLVMVVLESVDLSLQAIRFLLFHQFDIPLVDLFYFSEAAVRETVAIEANLDQMVVLVKCFQHLSFNSFAKEVVVQTDPMDFTVLGEGADQDKKAMVIQPT